MRPHLRELPRRRTLVRVVRVEGVEPPTPRLRVERSGHLSYTREVLEPTAGIEPAACRLEVGRSVHLSYVGEMIHDGRSGTISPRRLRSERSTSASATPKRRTHPSLPPGSNRWPRPYHGRALPTELGRRGGASPAGDRHRRAGRHGRDGGLRSHDPSVPNRVRFQAALRLEVDRCAVRGGAGGSRTLGLSRARRAL